MAPFEFLNTTAMRPEGLGDVFLERLEAELVDGSAEEALLAAFDAGPVVLAYSRFDEPTPAGVLESISPRSCPIVWAGATGSGGEFALRGVEKGASAVLRPVDSLEVTVVVDNALDLLSTVPESVTPEFPNDLSAGATEMSGPSVCCAAWGLSLYVSATTGGERHTVLFDAGPEGWAFERNSKRLGLEMSAVEDVALSHGHWDHAGGLPAALAEVWGSSGRAVPTHVNPGMFSKRGFRLGDDRVIPFGDVPSPDELERSGGLVVNDPGARPLASDTFFLSGEIPRVTAYEKGLPRQVKLEPDGSWAPDPLVLDERFLAVHLKDAGIVVFSACSHAGIVNVLTHARDVFAPLPLHAAFGGLHLSGAANESWIDDTVRDLAGFELARLVPGHCTGWRALHRLIDAFGDAVVPGAVGQTHRLGAVP